MVNHSSRLDVTFSALADPTRRAILERLTIEACTVTELAAPFNVSLPAISKHLRILERAGLLVCQKEGRLRRCRLQAAPLKYTDQWIERYRRFWEGQFDALAKHLNYKGDESEV